MSLCIIYNTCSNFISIQSSRATCHGNIHSKSMEIMKWVGIYSTQLLIHVLLLLKLSQVYSKTIPADHKAATHEHGILINMVFNHLKCV